MTYGRFLIREGACWQEQYFVQAAPESGPPDNEGELPVVTAEQCLTAQQPHAQPTTT